MVRFFDLDIGGYAKKLAQSSLVIIEIEDELSLRFEDGSLAGFLALYKNQTIYVAMLSTLLLVLQMSMNTTKPTISSTCISQ